MKKERAQWSGRVGFILAAAGSAVGLGNIWKFPGKAYEGGGGAFLLMYLLIIPLIGMPALFILLLVLLVRSVTLPGASEGLKYMLSLDMSKVSGQTFLIALSQGFYSLSLGMAIMVTYGSYLPKGEDMVRNTVLVCVMDTLVAFIAGFIVIPAVFATLGEGSVGKGGGFAFVSLAGVFSRMPAGALFGMLFYLLLLFAALTSTVSLIEGIAAFLIERTGASRTFVTIAICVIMFAIGCLYTCSQTSIDIRGVWFDLKNGLTRPLLCDGMEFLTDRIMIPLAALGCCLFAGWAWKPENVTAEVELCGKPFRLAKVYGFLIRFVVPTAIIVIFCVSLFTGTTLS